MTDSDEVLGMWPDTAYKILFLPAIYLFFLINISYSETNNSNNSDVTVEVGTSRIAFSESAPKNDGNDINIDAAIEMLISGHQAKMAETANKYRELAKLPRCSKSTRELIPGGAADLAKVDRSIAVLFFDPSIEDDRIAAEYSTADKVPYDHGNPVAVALAGEFGVRCLPTLVTKGGSADSQSGFIIETGRHTHKVLNAGSKKRAGKKRETK